LLSATQTDANNVENIPWINSFDTTTGAITFNTNLDGGIPLIGTYVITWKAELDNGTSVVVGTRWLSVSRPDPCWYNEITKNLY